jgi:hypothetical protein
MSKPKKGNKNQHNKGYSFNEALLQYNVKNYTGTLMRLKTATIKSHEVERAENLKQATLLRLAYDDLTRYLYQHDYEKAAIVFKKLIQQPDYQSFTVYYLLAELYVGQPEKYDDFKNWHALTFAQCTPFQQDYIHIAFYIIHQKFDHALNLVNLTKGASHAQQSHIDALKQVLSTEKTANVVTIAPTAKALYRLLLGQALQDFETAHFSAKQAELPLFVDIFKQQNSLTPDLISELKALCETDKIVNEGILARLIKAVPEAYRPYIAYNQAVNALNHDDFDISERGVKHIIVAYPQYFVQVPQSLDLYLKFHLFEDIKVYPNTFWQFFNQWLTLHKTRISTENADALGWSLFDSMLGNPSLMQGSHSRALINIYEAHPTMFSIKFGYIYFTTLTTTSPNLLLDKGCLDLFALPNAEKNKEKFAKVLDEMISALIAASQSSMFSFDDSGIPIGVVKNQLQHIGNTFIKAVTVHEIPPKNTIALEAFKIINNHIQDLFGNTLSKSDSTFVDTFAKTYNQLIEKFPNNKSIGTYNKDAAALKNIAYKVPFANLVRKGVYYTEYEAFLNKNPAIDDYTFAWEIFCDQIGVAHFHTDQLSSLLEFIKALFVKLGDSDALIKEAKNFVVAYKKMCEGFNCEHPTEFYAQLMSIFFKQPYLSPTLIYTFMAEYCLDFVAYKYKFEAKNYNAVGDFLEWLFRQKDRLKYYDKDLIKKLIAYLEEVNKIKDLKKLETTLKKARVLAA